MRARRRSLLASAFCEVDLSDPVSARRFHTPWVVSGHYLTEQTWANTAYLKHDGLPGLAARSQCQRPRPSAGVFSLRSSWAHEPRYHVVSPDGGEPHEISNTNRNIARVLTNCGRDRQPSESGPAISSSLLDRGSNRTTRSARRNDRPLQRAANEKRGKIHPAQILTCPGLPGRDGLEVSA